MTHAHEHYPCVDSARRDAMRLAKVRALVGREVDPGGRGAMGARMRRIIRRIEDRDLRDKACLWYCEWCLAHRRAPDAMALTWPRAQALRSRLLTALVNAGHTPPLAAWSWLAGVRVRGTQAELHWARVWAEFGTTARTARAVEGIRHDVPYCRLAGTPAARACRATLVAWRSRPIEILFRQAWECNRRTGRELSSRLEDEWYECVCSAFPGLPPVRHALLATRGMHVDMYWPQRDVALEVQGEPHWHGIPVFGGVTGLARRQQRDARKRAHCAAAGIRLVEVTPQTPVGPALAHLGGLLGTLPRAGAAGAG